MAWIEMINLPVYFSQIEVRVLLVWLFLYVYIQKESSMLMLLFYIKVSEKFPLFFL